MNVVRTPDERFDGLADFPFAPNYVEVADGDGDTLRVHYLDEGPSDAAPILLMHGEPTWSYLYRTIIPPLVAAGHRCIAPDLVGFGRSDKPTEQADYSYARHVQWMRDALFGELDLTGITMFAQDWGGLVGLRLVAAELDRFARVMIANTGMPTGEHDPGKAFLDWQTWSRDAPRFDVGRIIDGGSATDLSEAVIAAYDAPFPDDSYKAGARIFPTLVPTSPDDPASADNKAAWQTLAGFDKPFLCAFSDGDPITAGGDKPFRKLVAGAQGQPHTTIEGAAHFLQEDAPDQIVDLLTSFIAS